MKSICLKPWELAAYMREKKLLVVRPVKPQPDYSGSLTWEAIPDGNGFMSNRWFSESLFGTERWSGKCPFGKPGEALGIKEPWARLGNEDGAPIDANGNVCTPEEAHVIYRADTEPAAYGLDKLPDGALFDGRWKPAAQMPQHLIRHRPTIADIRVMRVGEMTAQEAWDAGARCECMSPVPQCKGNMEAFMEHWHKHYPTLSWGWGIFLEGT